MTDLKRTDQPDLTVCRYPECECDTSLPCGRAAARPDPSVDAGQSETTVAWMTADRAHLERLIADSDRDARWWWRRPLPWLVVRQYQRNEHVLCAHRWEWLTEICARRRTTSRRHATEIGVFYTARHRTHIRGERAAARRAES